MGSSFQLKLNAGMVCMFTGIIQSWLFEVTADGPIRSGRTKCNNQHLISSSLNHEIYEFMLNWAMRKKILYSLRASQGDWVHCTSQEWLNLKYFIYLTFLKRVCISTFLKMSLIKKCHLHMLVLFHLVLDTLWLGLDPFSFLFPSLRSLAK